MFKLFLTFIIIYRNHLYYLNLFRFPTYIFIIFLTLRSFSSLAQNESQKWYFGQFAGLDFITNPPTILNNSAMSAFEGCSSISNGAGNLLFYTDGMTVFNRTHQVMANGTGLNSHLSSTQGAAIVKKPSSSTLYYIFSQQGGNVLGGGCYYSVVDMSLAAGDGSVTIKNVSLYLPSTEKLVATKHCNGIDFWIITRDFDTPNFRTFLLTSAGVSSVVVSSTALTAVTGWTASIGYLKVSPNGKKIGNALAAGNLGYEIYDFDNSTGVLSNPTPLGVGINTAYGGEFSPDGTKFYGGTGGGANIGQVYQWDLCAGSATAIAASIFSVQGNSVAKLAFQLASNGKIYISRHNQSTLAVINNPNLAGSACNYVELGQSVSSGTCRWGLPNFIGSGLATPLAPFTHTLNNALGCQTASFTAPPAVQNFSAPSCAAAGYSPTGVQWIFGDPSSGSTNTSTLTNPSHAFTSLGTYTTTLIVYYTCGASNDTIRQQVVVNQPCFAVNSTSITCASLGSATVVPTAPGGPFSYTWMPTGQTNSVATGLSPGSYTLTVFNFGNNFTYTATINFTSLIPLSGTLNNSQSVTCNGAATATANFTGIAGGSAIQNYLWTNGVNNYTASAPNNLVAGNYTVIVTDALTGCIINTGFFINQPPALNLPLASSAPSVCMGWSVALTGTASGGVPIPPSTYNYTWTAGPLSFSYSPMANTVGNNIYTLTAADANGCQVSETLTVLVVPNPTLNFLSVSICPLQTATLTALGATTYTWNGLSTGNLFTDNPMATTMYTLAGTTAGCSAQATGFIILKPVPVPTLTTNGPRCNGDNLLLTGSVGQAYVWSGPSAFSAAIQNPTLNVVGLNNAGVYDLTLTAVNGCTAWANATVVVNPTPTLTAVGSTVCSSQTMSLTSSSFAGAVYLWSGPLGFSSGLQNISIVSPSLSQSGVYALTVTSVEGCTNTGSALVSVVPPPTTFASLSSNSLCAQALNGSPNTIILTGSGATTYTLVTPNHIYNPNPGGPVSPLNLVPPFNPIGPATATLLGSNGVCTTIHTATFLVVPNPTVSVTSPTPVICAGQSFTYTSFGASSYSWSAANPGNMLYTTGNIAVANPSINSVFSVIGGSLGCNSAIQSQVLTVNPLPQLSVNPASVCKNSSVPLIALGNGTSFSWTPAFFLNSTNNQSVSANPPASQNYQVVSSLNNCTVSAMAVVMVLPLPMALIAAPQTSVCQNELIILNGSAASPTTTAGYQWTGPGGFSGSAQNMQIKAVSNAYSGTYTLTLSDQNNCKGIATQFITVNNLPQAYLSSATMNGCAPLCTTLQLKQPDGSAALLWAEWQLANLKFSTKEFFYCFNDPGDYKLIGLLKDVNTCVNTVSSQVRVYPKPKADFDFNPQQPLENIEEVQFSGLSKDALTYQWHFGTVNFTSNQQNPKYVFENSGYYPIVLVVNNQWRCSDTLIKTIYVEPDFAVYVPDAFTPNEDGLNELFIPVIRGNKSFNFSIYDRWGAKIFETTDITKGWDGRHKNEPCAQGLYVWKLNVRAQSDDNSKKGRLEKNLSGTVVLYR